MKKIILIFVSIIALSAVLYSCSDNGSKADGYGNFESKEIIISSEVSGKILYLNLEEGQSLKAGESIGQIDTVQLQLKKEQLTAMKNAIGTKFKNIVSQVEVQKEQIKTAQIDKSRIEKMLKDGAATQKQLDDIQGRINVLESQIKSIETQNPSVFSELESYTKQIEQIIDQLKKSKIVNPINGIILEKYAEPNEIAVAGKALYKISNLSEVELKVYISGKQLPDIKIGQKVKVKIDDSQKEGRSFEGYISWISQKAEFTPKIIQTKEERVNLVYA
ncbi:MAG: HlyD family efflux transporter periplasmic adaptor subunit, partial [Bacteroidota bacterium]